MHRNKKQNCIIIYYSYYVTTHIFVFDNGTCVHTAHPLCNYKIIYTIIITLLRNSFRKKNVVGTYFRCKKSNLYTNAL